MHVMITGAGRGIGLALAAAYLSRGDRVLATVRAGRADGLTALACDRLQVLSMDVTSTGSVRAARASSDLPPLDVLIQNAGRSGGEQRAPGMDLARAEDIVQVNALGALRVYDAFVDLLRRGAPPRRLVNISSEAGSLGRFRASGKPEYAMSKAALNALTRWIAEKDPGLLCVSLDPGWTRTTTGGDRAPHTPEETAAALVSAIDRLSPAHHGGFYDTHLTPLPW